MKSEDFTQFTKSLPTALSFAIGKAKEFYKNLLEVTTGANIRIDAIGGEKILHFSKRYSISVR